MFYNLSMQIIGCNPHGFPFAFHFLERHTTATSPVYNLQNDYIYANTPSNKCCCKFQLSLIYPKRVERLLSIRKTVLVDGFFSEWLYVVL